MELKEASTQNDDDERWNDAFITTSESKDTTESEEDDEEQFLAADFLSFFAVRLFYRLCELVCHELACGLILFVRTLPILKV